MKSENILCACFISVVLVIIIGAYTYHFKVLMLKEKALAAGATVTELECVAPGDTALAACLLLAQKAQK